MEGPLPGYLRTLLVISFAIPVVAQGFTADELLNLKEQELNATVAFVQENLKKVCESLDDCNSSRFCSRLSCYKYATQDASKEYACRNVFANPNCGENCTNMNFDFNEGFVRLVVADKASNRTICAQRTLDTMFKSMSNQSHFFAVYYGSVDGTFRTFPGQDDDCVSIYDPRLRPWYLKSVYVPKDVVVLLNAGPQMNNKLNAGEGEETFVNLAKSITLKFLDTLNEYDLLKIMLFAGEIAAWNLTGDFEQVMLNKTTGQPLLPNTRKGLASGIATSGSNPIATDASNAINAAISLLEQSGKDARTHLKVIIVLTAGSELNSSSLTSIRNSEASLFVYNLLPRSGQEADCNGSSRIFFDAIPAEYIKNPLYALRSYYSYLAKIHDLVMGSRIDYSQQYSDFFGIDNDTFTLSKAVFDHQGDLKGVVGIDFFINILRDQYNLSAESLKQAARTGNRLPGVFSGVSNFPSLGICSNYTNPCPGVTSPIGSICQPVENTTPLVKLSCCGKCSKTEGPDWPVGMIARVVAGVVGGVLAVLAAGYICFPCYKGSGSGSTLKSNSLRVDYEFEGNSEESPRPLDGPLDPTTPPSN